MKDKTEMILYKNGYIVVTVNSYFPFSYKAWPLQWIEDDTANKLTEEADERWFTVYAMYEIAPDLDYVRRYVDCCRKMGIEPVVLLVETPEKGFVVNDEIVPKEILGFDCFGTVGFSYLKTDVGVSTEGLPLNKYGLFDSQEDALEYGRRRREVIASGVNLEDYWEETPIRLSVIQI